MKRLLSFFLLMILTITSIAQVQTKRPGVNINSNLNGLIELLPQGYNPSGPERYPLIIFFMGLNATGPGTDASLESMFGQGGGFIHDQARDINSPFPSSFTAPDGSVHKFIVITPQFVTNFNTRRPTPQEVNDLITYSLNNYRVDPTRVYLMGNSAGAQLPWDYTGFSSAYANRIAAIVPFAGTSFPSEEKANKIKYADVAVWAFHNTGDPAVPFAFSRDYINLLRQPPDPVPVNRAKSTFRDFNVHNTTYEPLMRTYTDNGLDVFEWMLQFRRTITNANAGNDKDITLPVNSVQLDGSGSGPNGSTNAFNWFQKSGPTTASISNQSAANPTVSNLSVGTYVFTLGISDNGGQTATDNVTVRVYPTRIQAESFLLSSVGTFGTSNTLDEDNSPIVNGMQNGERLDYSVNVPVAGNYTLRFRLSSFYNSNVQFDIKDGSGRVLSTMNPYWTENFSTYITQSDTIPLAAGNQTLSFEITGFNEFNFNWFQLISQSVNAPLPVNFSLFNSNCINGGVNLTWKTSGETDSKDFTVERSVDGRNWQSITTIPSAGQSTTERSYSYSDNAAGASNFYRITETGQNGRKTYSTIIRSNCAGKSVFSVFPNPVKDKAVVSINVDQKTTLMLTVNDARGALVKKQEVPLLSGTNQVSVDMTGLPTGTYTLNAQYGTERKIVKLVKN